MQVKLENGNHTNEQTQYYEVRRNDGRRALNYIYTNKTEAEKDARELHSDAHLFRYSVREVFPPGEEEGEAFDP